MLVFQGKPTLLPCASKRWHFESFQAPQLPGWFFWPGLLPSEEMPGCVPTSALHQLPGYLPFLNYGPSLLVLLHIPFCIAAEQLRVSLFSPISWEGRNVLLEYLRNNSLPLDSIWAEIWNIKSKKKKRKKSWGMVDILTFKSNTLKNWGRNKYYSSMESQGRYVLAAFQVTTDIFIFIHRRDCRFCMKTVRNYLSFKQLCAQCF